MGNKGSKKGKGKASREGTNTSSPDLRGEAKVEVNLQPQEKESRADEMRPVAIQFGEGLTRAGYPPHDKPRSVFATVVGRPKQPTMGGKDLYVGDEAESKRRVLNLTRPIQRGVVKDWNDMEMIWQHTFDSELRCDPRDHPVILTLPPLIARDDLERIGQIMLETFEVPGLCLALEQTLSLHHNGYSTGIVLDSGEGVTYAVPIYEGHVLQHAVGKADIGGRDITELLEKLLIEKDLYVPKNAQEREKVRELKETAGCYVALDFQQELLKSVSCKAELDDGRTIDISDACFRAPEGLFQSGLYGLEGPGIHNLVYDAIMKCDVGIRNELFSHIVISGGNTLFKGLPERLQKEIAQLAPSGTNVKIIGGQERRFSTYLGASGIASLPSFKDRLITRAEWDEEGACVVHRKCW